MATWRKLISGLLLLLGAAMFALGIYRYPRPGEDIHGWGLVYFVVPLLFLSIALLGTAGLVLWRSLSRGLRATAIVVTIVGFGVPTFLYTVLFLGL